MAIDKVKEQQARIRRPKVYCDHWIHNGTCAFAQRGCAYKHEMPRDYATQQLVGLNGYPTWYKKWEAEQKAILAVPHQTRSSADNFRPVGTITNLEAVQAVVAESPALVAYV